MPAFLAFLPGMLIGSKCFSLLIHWLTLLLSGWRRNPIDAPLPTTGRVLARIFTVIHPLPWLLLLGIPYGIHRLITNPPAAGWRWFFAGAIGQIVVQSLLAVMIFRKRSRVESDAPRAST